MSLCAQTCRRNANVTAALYFLTHIPYKRNQSPSTSTAAAHNSKFNLSKTTHLISPPPPTRMMNNRSVVEAEPSAAEQRWRGWPGQNVFRMIVPTASVGCILGNEGETIKRICRETRASVRVFNRSQVPIPYTIVFIFGREEPEQEHSRAMLAATRVFRRATFFTTSDDDDISSVDVATCLVTTRFLVHADHVNFLTGRQRNILNSIQEETGAVLCITSVAETMPYYPTEDEQVIKIEGEAAMVVRAFKSLLGQLRRFLVDRGVIQLFEQKYYEAMSRVVQSTNSGRSDPEPTTIQQQPANSSMDVLQMIHRIELPLIVVDRIIGDGGTNMECIHRTSNATIIVDASPCFADEAVVKIIGTNSQISMAVHLIYSDTNGMTPSVPLKHLFVINTDIVEGYRISLRPSNNGRQNELE